MAPKQSLWTETAVYVQKSFRLNKALAHKVPNKITFTDDDNKLFFLAGSGRSTLYSVDLEQEKDPEDPLEHSQFFDSSYVNVSRKEELLRERQRICKNGITTFEYRNNTLLVPLGSNLYYHDITNELNEPQIIKESDMSHFFDPKLCPVDPRVISFIRNNDIFVTAAHSPHYLQLTHSDNPTEVYNGVPSFIIQEEFDRYTGYYWRPVEDTEDKYHILYEHIDESEVPTVHINAGCEESSQEYKFPLVGQKNAVVSLKIVRFSVETEETSKIERFDLKDELQVTFSWLEYIPWFGWNPSGSSVWAMLLDRRQQKLSIVDIPLQYFTEHDTDCPVTVLYHKSCDTYINVSDDIYFFDSVDGVEDFKFILKTEERFSHLYYITLRSDGKDELKLTDGEWCVTSLVGVDRTTNVVYFHGLKNPTQQHLYSVSIDEPCNIKQLTVSGYFHDCTLNHAKDAFVSVFSNLHTHYQCGIFSAKDGTLLKTIVNTFDFSQVYLKKACVSNSEETLDLSNDSPANNAHNNHDTNNITMYKYDPPLLDKVLVDGEDVYCLVYPAKGVDLSTPQPVLLYVYGGPEIQLVQDRFRGIHHRQQNLMATLGYTVIIADCPGSANRGKLWAERLYKQMGTVEVDLQIKALQELSKKYAYIDLSRVAIIGTSYGGYVSLMALAQRSDFFKLSIAIAPATAWYLYDTAYSERYMGLITENEKLYHETSSVMHYVNKFPSEEHRLLIIHGLMDENVHFTHTTTLINALISAAKPYDLQVYPEERHGIGRGNAPGHCDTTIALYLINNL